MLSLIWLLYICHSTVIITDNSLIKTQLFWLFEHLFIIVWMFILLHYICFDIKLVKYFHVAYFRVLSNFRGCLFRRNTVISSIYFFISWRTLINFRILESFDVNLCKPLTAEYVTEMRSKKILVIFLLCWVLSYNFSTS